jgi:hypothetical protein
LRRHPRGVEAFAYGLFAAALALWSAHHFFASLRFQLFLSNSHAGVASAFQEWSAPLDDVFIHFDFARSAARGYPFQWSEGNGYSSGGTSLAYPFLLSIGYRVGYEREDLMLWAGMVAVASVVYGLMFTRKLAAKLPWWCSWLLPIALLSTGVLNWTLWSGMEVAFFFAIWAVCAAAFVKLTQVNEERELTWPAVGLGFAGALLTATRPEAAVTVACFALVALVPKLRRVRFSRWLAVLLLAGLPGASVVVGHALANRWFTGDFSAAGALVKLELNHPYLSASEVLEAWKFHFGYQVLRVTNYHLSSSFNGSGWAAWALAFYALFDKRTRQVSVLLWLSTLTFMAVVALNGQVRWQNERYAMPALLWLLLNAGLGLGAGASALASSIARYRATRNVHGAAAPMFLGVLTLVLGAFFWYGQGEARTGQQWFFGRAARNIFDQHIAAARRLRHLNPGPSRVLVGDAGAIPYVTDVPALDIIGLGGYQDLPFARATRHGVAAAIELIERLPPQERPDMMAIYPSWWSELPLWFGRELWATGVRGNVICGGREKVVYRPDWSPFSGSAYPAHLGRHDRVRWELDIADLVSEGESHAKVVGAPGFVTMKMLQHPADPTRDMWDAGRVMPPGSSLDFTVEGVRVHEPLRLLFRVAPVHSIAASLWTGGDKLADIVFPQTNVWHEAVIDLPAASVDAVSRLELRVERGELVLYHLWGVQTR